MATRSRQQIEILGLGEEACKHILHGGGDEEVLLPQPELAPFGRAVVRIEHAAHGACADAGREASRKRRG